MWINRSLIKLCLILNHRNQLNSIYWILGSTSLPENDRFYSSRSHPIKFFLNTFGIKCGRNRRPPRDPVNALLSLTYVISGGEIRRAILQRGLDPALGFLHASQSGRESLALDILEPLRPEVDLFVLTLLDSSLNLKHFTTNDQDGCLLNKKGRSAFFKAWAKWQEPDGENKRTLKSMAENFVRDLITFFP